MNNKSIETKKKVLKVQKLKRNLTAWAIMLPSLLLFAFFVWVPILKNIGVSFYSDYEFSNFVAFDNYKEIFADDSFFAAFKNTFVYILWSLVIGYFVPIVIGFLLSECFHAKSFFRICIYIPCMISGIAVVFLFKNIYGDETYSILNVIIKMFGGDPQRWAGDPNLIIPLIVIAMTWKGAGATSLIYLSIFQQIDTNLYEASRIDGANPLQRFTRVTLPQMKSTLLTLFILQVISVFQVFYEPLVIGNWGGPVNDASMSLMLLSYSYAFRDSEFGYAAATSVILTLIIIACTILYFIVTKYLEKKGER